MARVLVLTLLLLASLAMAGDSTIPTRVLEVPTEGSPLPLWAAPLFGSIECDSRGGVFVRELNYENTWQSPVLRLSKDGVQRFELPSVVDLPGETTAFGFSAGASGDVTIAVGVPKSSDIELRLLHFDRDGKFRRQTVVEPFFTLAAIHSLPDDRYLLIGIRRPITRGAKGIPVMGIFDRDGKLIKSFVSKNDKQVTGTGAGAGLFNPNFQFAKIRSGPDGTLYVFKPDGESAAVDVISPAGELVRTLKLSAPVTGLHAFEMYLAGNRLLVSYQRPAKIASSNEPDTRLWHGLYDLESGQLQAILEQKERGILACANYNELTFLTTTKSRHFALATATMQ